jgi:hypothetical protein
MMGKETVGKPLPPLSPVPLFERFYYLLATSTAPENVVCTVVV